MKITTRRITYWAIMLALFCVLGMFSIQFGDTIKVSIQLFIVFLIGMLSPGILDSFIISTCYLLLGLFLPIYAGFSSGITPTFGFVIGFIPGSIILTLIAKIFKGYIDNFIEYKFSTKEIKKMIFGLLIGCVASTIIVYVCGATFMYFYFQGLGKAKDVLTIIGICITPYIPFDIIKIILSISVYLALYKPLKVLNIK